MEKLLLIPGDYWSRFVEVVESETFTSTPVSTRHPGVLSVAK